MTERFTITFKRGAYYVSIPNYAGGEVVPAEAFDRISAEYLAIMEMIDPPMVDGVWTGTVAEGVQATIFRLTAEQATLQNTIDVLESNASVQAKLLADTGRERDRLRKALQGLLHDPEPDHDEPDEDWKVIRKMRDAVRAALATPAVSDADRAPE